MKIIVANSAGFCMGVRRAVEMVLDAPTKYPAPIFTFGPLIHNPQVLQLFAEKGVTVLDSVPAQGEGTVIIRAHGVPPVTRSELKQAGFTVVDATCPRVIKVQSYIKSHCRKGYSTIIVGDENHPEVISLLGFAGSEGHVVNSLASFKTLPQFQKAIVVAQTTQNKELYKEITQWTAQHHRDYKVFDTICDSTEKRQAEVRELAKEVDTIIVVGGKESGNTRRLAEIAQSTGKPAFHVETEAELDPDILAEMKTVGITAGASTPTWIIKAVFKSMEQIPFKRWRGWMNWITHYGRLLLLTNFFVALGAGCLCYAMIHLLELPMLPPALAVAFLYILSMHTLNHLTGQDADKYNEPEREQFYQRFRLGLITLTVFAGGLGLFAAFQLGIVPFWTLLAMSLLGLSYNLKFIPQTLFPNARYRRIRDLPGSKTILITLAWGVVTTGVPVLAAGHTQLFSSILVMVWATGFVFCRTAFFDVLDMQGDRIVGKETLPILLGTKKTLKLLKGILVVLFLVILLSGILSKITYLAFPLAICPLLLWLIIIFHEHDHALPGARIEFLVEGLFLLAGLITLAYLYIGNG